MKMSVAAREDHNMIDRDSTELLWKLLHTLVKLNGVSNLRTLVKLNGVSILHTLFKLKLKPHDHS